ncbi:MAG TPA: hypothetical protein VFA90_04195 [Terriglobales bacterium]|nr:hypothetical protein [Terriglobales bacterium]
MVVDYPKLFHEAAQELSRHAAHRISVLAYGGDFDRDGITLKCEDCRRVLVEFMPTVKSLGDEERAHASSGEEKPSVGSAIADSHGY